MHKRNKVIALYSGGLDSTLAVLVMLKQGSEVIAVNFTTPFGCSPEDKSSCSNASATVASEYGFTLKYFPLGDEFINMVKGPEFGYGKNMNPCIDCRIMMLKKAKKLMQALDAGCIITGEVIGQRPMSQQRHTMNFIEKKTELRGYLLRPLSAKLLPPTIAEQEGMVNRDKLYGFTGRSRKNQLALAEEFKLKEIPQPAAGCLLTNLQYSKKLRDLLEHNKGCDYREIALLRIGRHFRICKNIKLILGRNEKENKILEQYDGSAGILTPADDTPGPTAILRGSEIDAGHIDIASRICAKYSDGKINDYVSILHKNQNKIYKAEPAGQAMLKKYLVL